MKKKTILILSIILFTTLSLLASFYLFKIYQENKAQKRYSEIRKSVKKAVEWHIKASYPKCPITKKNNKTKSVSSFLTSSFLISNGYIKKEELLDIDNASYCSVLVKVYPYFENPLDYQNNCEVSYKIYIKCKDYKDKGYVNWG